MKYSNVLITGATGRVGKAILKSNLINREIFAPTRDEMDITNEQEVLSYFSRNKIDIVIHCAAMTDVRECEKKPEMAVNVNILGTLNIVQAALKNDAVVIYLSTDYVYPCTKGPYAEKDETIPFTVYGWTKLGGECAVKTSKNFCIIRTSLFEPEKISFDTAPIDAFVSKITFTGLAEAINLLIDKEFNGIINVGQERISLYDLYKKFKPDIKPISIDKIPKEAQRARDSSLDISIWKKISSN